MSLEYFIIYVYCCVDMAFKAVAKNKKIRRCGSTPSLSDEEVIAMEVIGEYLGFDQDKQIWLYFLSHWASWFPNLGSRTSVARQAANLYKYKQLVQTFLASLCNGFSDDIHIIDAFPIPICQYTRSNRCKLFKESARYGVCASKHQKYYGLKGVLLINFDGIICGYTVISANKDEREAVWEVINSIHGLLLGDKGYISRELQYDLKSIAQIDLQMLMKDNMRDNRDPAFLEYIKKTRFRIETVIGQLTDRFHIEKVRARDLWHFTSRFIRKILAHTVGCFLNILLKRPVLQFEGLITA